MAASPGRTVLRRQLGKELRKLREAAGKTTADVAKHLGLKGASTVSKIENGKQAIRPINVRLMCELYGVSQHETGELLVRAEEADKPSHMDSYTDTMPNWLSRFVGLEEDASEIIGYQIEVVPGLLQTADYIRALRLSVEPNATEDDLQRSVNFRQARQARLHSDNPPQVRFIVGEAALLREVGGRSVRQKQLRHLLELAELPHIDLRVLPFASGGHPAMTAAFTMLHFDEAEDLDLVYIEHDLGAVYLEKPEQVARFTVIADQLRQAALTSKDSMDAIAKVAGAR